MLINQMGLDVKKINFHINTCVDVMMRHRNGIKFILRIDHKNKNEKLNLVINVLQL